MPNGGATLRTDISVHERLLAVSVLNGRRATQQTGARSVEPLAEGQITWLSWHLYPCRDLRRIVKH